MADVVKAFELFRFNVSVLLTSNSGSDFSSSVTQALTDFVHSLQVVLNQIQANQTPPTDNGEVTNPPPTDAQTGFNNFINDLFFLINNNTSSPLQSNFDFLVNLLSPNSPTVGQNPSLSDFLSMMLINLQNNEVNNQNDAGTSIATEV